MGKEKQAPEPKTEIPAVSAASEMTPIAPALETAPAPQPRKKTWLIVAVAIILAAVLGALGLLAYRNYYSSKLISRDSVVPTVTSTPIPDETAGWKSYTIEKITDKDNWKFKWSGVKLYYPEDWSLEKTDETTKISKGENYFEIIRGAAGGGYCLFPDDSDYESFTGMVTKYGSDYYQIDKGDGIIWRLVKDAYEQELWSHHLCEKNKTMHVGDEHFYDDNVAFGFVKIKVANDNNLQELKRILEKLEILK